MIARIFVAVTLAALVLGAAACAPSSREPSEADIEALIERIEDEVADEPGVIEVRASADGALPWPTANFVVELRTEGLSDDELATLGTDVARRIWFSDLSSITSVMIRFPTPPDQVDRDLSHVSDLEPVLTRSDLEELFGPRDGG